MIQVRAHPPHLREHTGSSENEKIIKAAAQKQKREMLEEAKLADASTFVQAYLGREWPHARLEEVLPGVTADDITRFNIFSFTIDYHH